MPRALSSLYKADIARGYRMTFVPRQRPVVLCVLDGWGHRHEQADDNAILHARTPNLDRLSRESPIAYLQASELHVGLPAGQMGNSEVGHMNLGAGRVVMLDGGRLTEPARLLV